jgi:hypothetical protein
MEDSRDYDKYSSQSTFDYFLLNDSFQLVHSFIQYIYISIFSNLIRTLFTVSEG